MLLSCPLQFCAQNYRHKHYLQIYMWTPAETCLIRWNTLQCSMWFKIFPLSVKYSLEVFQLFESLVLNFIKSSRILGVAYYIGILFWTVRGENFRKKLLYLWPTRHKQIKLSFLEKNHGLCYAKYGTVEPF